MTTREEIIGVATGLHDEAGCSCDRRYLMSCPGMASAILRAGQVIREREQEEPVSSAAGVPMSPQEFAAFTVEHRIRWEPAP